MWQALLGVATTMSAACKQTALTFESAQAPAQCASMTTVDEAISGEVAPE